jgi:hypothetical protein
MRIVFNEVSVSNIHIEPRDVFSAVETFIETYSRFIKISSIISRTIITPVDINTLQLTSNCCIAQWRNSPNVDKDLSIRFKGMCDRQSIEDILADDIEVSHNDIIGKGFQIAYENDLPLLSFRFDDRWTSAKIECAICSLSEEIFTCSIVNYSDIASVEIHENWLNNRISREKLDYDTPEQIIVNIERLFPSLAFSDVAISQLKSEIQTVHIPMLVDRLFKLEDYFSKWDGTIFNDGVFPRRLVSPESKETIDTYRNEYTFEFESEILLVSHHMRYTGEGRLQGRIYFVPHSLKKKCIIYSLHTKLPTVLYPK